MTDNLIIMTEASIDLNLILNRFQIKSYTTFNTFISKVFENLSNQLGVVTGITLSEYLEMPLPLVTILIKTYSTNNELDYESFYGFFKDVYFYNPNIISRIIDLIDYKGYGYISKSSVKGMLFYMDLTDDLDGLIESILPENNLSNEEFENKVKRSNSDVLFVFLFYFIYKRPFDEYVLEYFISTENSSDINFSEVSIAMPSLPCFLLLRGLYKNKSKLILSLINVIGNFFPKSDDDTGSDDAIVNSIPDSINIKKPCQKEEKSKDSIKSLKSIDDHILCEVNLYKYNIIKKVMVKFRAVMHKKYLILFKNEYKNKVKHIYCLTTTFIKKSKIKETISDIQYYRFELIMRMKKRNFYMKQEHTYKLLTDLLDVHRNIENYYTYDHIIYQHGNIKVISAIDLNGHKAVIKRLGKYNRKKDHEHALNELELMKRLKHKNIVRYLNSFEDIDNIYIVLENLEGGDLSTYLSDRKEPLNDENICQIIKDITDGIEYLHKTGIMHRDLKLKNVAMTDHSNNATAKLIDFGLSIFHNEGFLNDCCGTKYFTAPEVLKSNYNIKADIWSFGIIVYFLIYNKFPFMTDSSDTDDYILLFPSNGRK